RALLARRCALATPVTSGVVVTEGLARGVVLVRVGLARGGSAAPAASATPAAAAGLTRVLVRLGGAVCMVWLVAGATAPVAILGRGLATASVLTATIAVIAAADRAVLLRRRLDRLRDLEQRSRKRRSRLRRQSVDGGGAHRRAPVRREGRIRRSRRSRRRLYRFRGMAAR
ncbi:MAG TPA: hypothetical protein VK103_00880, partial [Bacillota bacterium]|nr:hypothetical protein [Bacillota bacterium]